MDLWVSVNADPISYICGDKYPACSCRSIPAVLNDEPQIGEEGDIDVATVVAAMEIAERGEDRDSAWFQRNISCR